MCLLDTVVGWDDERIHLETDSHRRADKPLRSDGVLRAVHLCEYGAQAMAVHGGLLAQRAGTVAAPGLLATSSVPVLRAIGLTVALGVAFHFCLSIQMAPHSAESHAD